MESLIGPAIVAAAISALVSVIGWYVSHARDVAREAARRRDKIIDMQKALRAEIRHHAIQLQQAEQEDYAETMLVKIEEEDGFFPLVPRAANDFVFRALLAQIDLLPTEAVDPVVAYYAQIGAISAFVEDMRSEAVPSWDEERRMAAYGDFIEMRQVALGYALDAIAALDAGIAGQEAGLDADGVSNPGGGRAAPLQEA